MTIRDDYALDSDVRAQDNETLLRPIRVWDLPVRLFHWTLVAAFAGAFITNRLGVSYFKYHVWCGYTVLVLVSFRILWGFVGTYHARFRNFVRGPITTAAYAHALVSRAHAHLAGHNPLGAWMVIFLLGALFIQAASGLFSTDDIINAGPYYAAVTKETAASLSSLHRRLFYWIAFAVLLHIAAVVAHKFFDGSDLIRAMFSGRKRIGDSNIPSSQPASAVLALGLLATVVIVLVTIIYVAPPAADDF